jgi:hypothetical protein
MTAEENGLGAPPNEAKRVSPDETRPVRPIVPIGLPVNAIEILTARGIHVEDATVVLRLIEEALYKHVDWQKVELRAASLGDYLKLQEW